MCGCAFAEQGGRNRQKMGHSAILTRCPVLHAVDAGLADEAGEVTGMFPVDCRGSLGASVCRDQ